MRSARTVLFSKFHGFLAIALFRPSNMGSSAHIIDRVFVVVVAAAERNANCLRVELEHLWMISAVVTDDDFLCTCCFRNH